MNCPQGAFRLLGNRWGPRGRGSTYLGWRHHNVGFRRLIFVPKLLLIAPLILHVIIVIEGRFRAHWFGTQQPSAADTVSGLLSLRLSLGQSNKVPEPIGPMLRLHAELARAPTGALTGADQLRPPNQALTITASATSFTNYCRPFTAFPRA